jgi:protein-L-isoaspartate(D-aspartate) O-methyltransferase
MDFAVQRANMVESQVRPSDISDRRVVRAMSAVPRERFAGPSTRSLAYMDEALRVADGRFLLAPRVLAKMIQLAEIGDKAIVLDIGVATGYSAAVLAHIAETVVAIEQDGALAAAATETLAALSIDNVAVLEGPHSAGMASEGPYDAILLQGSVPEIPRGLLDQLKDGGRVVAIVADGNGGPGGFGRVVVRQRVGTGWDLRPGFDAGGPPLPGFERKRSFVL